MLFDNHGRRINYVRLAVTDRCNLRCTYCMPAQGITYVPRPELMTFEEMFRLVQVLHNLGVEKVRITGGEPFVRHDLMDFIAAISSLNGIKIHLTTNGTLTGPHLSELRELGVRDVNLSLDSLDRERFREMTRRDALPQVLDTLNMLLQEGFQTKINTVVLEGKNTEDILPLVELARHLPVDVRFIEEMPFNGSGLSNVNLAWNHVQILTYLSQQYPEIEKLPDLPFSTSSNYQIPGFRGKVGIIAAYSRTFCGTCNRLRITPQGLLKTCLYDAGVFNVKDLMRQGASDVQLSTALLNAIGHRARNGFEAEQQRMGYLPTGESMSSIGG